MDVTFWGTRGSIASAGSATQRYGGNTAAVQVTGRDGTILVLDAGTGIREIADSLPTTLRRLDIFLSHLHMDHIQGLGFFAPMFIPSLEVHVWGPPSATLDLRRRLTRYLSPPLFPVRLRDLSSRRASPGVSVVRGPTARWPVSDSSSARSRFTTRSTWT